MKKDQLEQYIQDHRADFDSELPALKNWYHIEKAMEVAEQGKRRVLWRKRLVRAASILLLLCAGGVIGSLLTQQFQADAMATATESTLPNEVTETERYYQRAVQEKLALLAAYPQENAEVLADLKDQDAFLAELRLELQQAPQDSEEILLYNIIETYQIKLSILETVLRELEQSQLEKSRQYDQQI
ncbi:MAG: hypothetical protein AAGI23_16240 [Bacteroidota bacterium]